MALITCPECGRQISDKAHQCPHCGYPSSLFNNSSSNPTEKNECNHCNENTGVQPANEERSADVKADKCTSCHGFVNRNKKATWILSVLAAIVVVVLYVGLPDSKNIPNNQINIPNNQIWYEADEKISNANMDNITSHEYSDGKGIITFNQDVTSIGKWAFFNCSSLRCITLPNSIKSIGEGAFHNCDSLSRITIPNSVTSIGKGAFCSCMSLSSVTIPDSLKIIVTRAFQGCSSLSRITIPNFVTSIGYNAFAECSNLSSVTIPNSVTSIRDWAFYGCNCGA